LVITSDDLPGLLEGLYVTADYYDIRVDNAIDTPNIQYLLDSCYKNAEVPTYCKEIIDQRMEDGLISNIDLIIKNVSRYETSDLISLWVMVCPERLGPKPGAEVQPGFSRQLSD